MLRFFPWQECDLWPLTFDFLQVCAYDVSGAYKGPLFRVPIIVLVPTEYVNVDGANFIHRLKAYGSGLCKRYKAWAQHCEAK